MSLVFAIGLGLFMIGKRVGAATPTGRTFATGLGVVRGATALDATADAAAADATSGALVGDAFAATGPRDAGDPLDYAVVQTDADFPKEMSAEEKSAIGTGKVPIHREGPYRSPLAHPRFGGPAHAKVGLVIREVREFDIQTGGYDADFFLSLTSDKPMPKLNLVFTNGHDVTLSPLADTPTFKLYSVTGSFSTRIDLRRYPFDTQRLRIKMEDAKAGADQIVFVADGNRTSLDSSFLLTSYAVAGLRGLTYKHRYPPRFDRDDLYVSRYEFTLEIERFAMSAAFSVYVPALIIVLISLTGMWCPPSELEVRSNSGAPMLAAAVLFHYSLIQALPATGYLTRADKLMLGVYISLLLNMVSTWMLLLGDDDFQLLVFKKARTYVPIATAIVMVAAILW